MAITLPPTPVPNRLQSQVEFDANWQSFLDWFQVAVPQWNTLAVGSTSTGNFNNLLLDGSQVFARSNILGTVSEASGVPTGAIVERGGEAPNGYVRFADGTQICHARLNLATGGDIPAAVSTAIGSTGLYRSASALTWNLPVNFGSTTDISIVANFRRASAIASGVHINSFTTSSVSFYPWSSTSYAEADAKEVHITVMGRW